MNLVFKFESNKEHQIGAGSQIFITKTTEHTWNNFFSKTKLSSSILAQKFVILSFTLDESFRLDGYFWDTKHLGSAGMNSY